MWFAFWFNTNWTINKIKDETSKDDDLPVAKSQMQRSTLPWNAPLPHRGARSCLNRLHMAHRTPGKSRARLCLPGYEDRLAPLPMDLVPTGRTVHADWMEDIITGRVLPEIVQGDGHRAGGSTA